MEINDNELQATTPASALDAAAFAESWVRKSRGMPDEGDSRTRPSSHGAQIVPVSLDTILRFGHKLRVVQQDATSSCRGHAKGRPPVTLTLRSSMTNNTMTDLATHGSSFWAVI